MSTQPSGISHATQPTPTLMPPKQKLAGKKLGNYWPPHFYAWFCSWVALSPCSWVLCEVPTSQKRRLLERKRIHW